MANDVQNGGVTTNQQAITGNLVEIWAAGRKIGYVQTLDGQNDYGLTDLSGIGDGHVQEWVPTIAHHTISVNRAVLRKASFFKLLSEQAPNVATNPFINMDGALQGIVFDIAVVQKAEQNKSATTIRWWRRVSIASDSFSISKGAISYHNVSMRALDVQEDMSGAGFNGVSDMDATNTN